MDKDINYVKIRSRSLLFRKYVFIDTVDHLYERLITGTGIICKRVREYCKAESPYRLIECTIKKKDEGRFRDVVANIRNSALLLGYTEYDEFCRLMQSCGEE